MRCAAIRALTKSSPRSRQKKHKGSGCSRVVDPGQPSNSCRVIDYSPLSPRVCSFQSECSPFAFAPPAAPEDRTSLTEVAWVYVCLGRNADALRIAREATESLPIEKDALVGANFLAGLAQIDAHIGRPEEAVKILRQLLTIPAGEYISVAHLKIDPVHGRQGTKSAKL